MSIEVKVPVLPESVADATVASWHKAVGEAVSRDENLVDLETDKVVLEVPAPADGVLREIRAEPGATVGQDELLAIIEEGAAAEAPAPAEAEAAAAEAAAPEPAPAEAAAEAAAAAAPEAAPRTGAGDEAPGTAAPEGKAEEPVAARYPEDERLSPSARRLVAEHGLDAGRIEGSGRAGRVTKEDVLAFLEQGEAPGASEAPPSPEAAPRPAAAPVGERPEERVPMSRLRQRIAERMVEAQNTAAMLTSFNEVDLSEVIALRQRHKEEFQERHGVKLGFMSFFVKAACEALRRHPVVNATMDGSDIVYHGYCDIGIAVSTDRGLMVPVLRSAEVMSLAEIEAGIADYARQARDGSIRLADLQGGTFTITNGGVFGSLVSTPILNMPQSAILGMHAIKERPVVVDGQIVARPMMYLALTYDHRIVDGRDAVLFLVAIKDALEDPSRMLLDL